MSEQPAAGERFLLSRATYCYEAVQRIFRTSMLRHARAALRSEYPHTWLEQLRLPFGLEWEKIAQSALRFQAAGTLDARAEDEFEYLGVNHFHTLVAKHFPLLFPREARLPALARDEARGAILRQLKEIKDFRDGMSHPVSADFSLLDAVIAMRAASRVLARFDGEAAHQVDGLIREVLLAPLVDTAATAQQEVVDIASAPMTKEAPSKASQAVEALFMEFEALETYEALRDFFRANAEALESDLHDVAERHERVARALTEFIDSFSESGDVTT